MIEKGEAEQNLSTSRREEVFRAAMSSRRAGSTRSRPRLIPQTARPGRVAQCIC